MSSCAPPSAASPGDDAAQALNSACFCVSLDRQALGDAMEGQIGAPALAALLRERCPHVFAERPVFVGAAHLRQMAEVVRAVEQVVALPAWRELALGSAPPIARHEPRGARGVFFGHDFHLSGGALGLIEINTNAGGAMLNALLARAQRACCEAVEPWVPSAGAVDRLEQDIVDMFRQEWDAGAPGRPLRSVAIVDEDPQQQYLYPEFLLFQRLLTRHGLQVVIADPSELALREGRLWHADMPIDLVYNRLTDFYLDTPPCATLRQAYLDDAVVLTPHPQAYALYADKRRLVTLSDAGLLAALRVPDATADVLLACVPRTVMVTPEAADMLWTQRRQWFFKPVSGWGGRAAYRGDKLTRRVWQEICEGGYVAQATVAPGERRLQADEGGAMKFDLRNYVYDGRVQWVAARLYQGQTTNFRTAGGGFAPVFTTRDTGLPAVP